ncbi:MAG: hypothetical protein R3B13_24935 [Polyangiaceae bacterium]
MKAVALVSMLGTLLASAGCRPEAEPPLVKSAELGVFFGGQIQQRSEIPLQHDTSKQTQGFRLRFSRPLTHPVLVRWEVDMPGAGRRVRDAEGRRGYGRLVKLAEANARAGLEVFDQAIPFAAQDSPGTWNVRVHVDDVLALDRSLWVYDPVRRRRDERDEQARVDAERTADLLPAKRK